MFLCVFVHKKKNGKREVICHFSVFCVCAYKKRRKIKRKSIFVFPFLCFLVHKTIKQKSFFVFPFFVFVCTYSKRKNDKTEVKFRLSFTPGWRAQKFGHFEQRFSIQDGIFMAPYLIFSNLYQFIRE